MSKPALSIHTLRKIYKGGYEALKGITFSVAQGDFFALLGENGAGKSTTIGIITSLVKKTDGKVLVYGHDIDQDFLAAKTLLGLVPQEFNCNPFFRVIDVVLNQAGYYGISRDKAWPLAKKYMSLLGLWERKNQTVLTLSGGFKRRLMIARALIHDPKILILDEPTAGVDIGVRRSMWKFLKELNAEGKTIILTTHYLEEAEQLCRHVAIIDQGTIIAHRSMTDILQSLDTERFVLYLSSPLREIPNIRGYTVLRIDDMTLEVEVPQSAGLSRLFEAFQHEGIKVASMRNKANRLEELFLVKKSF